MKVDASQNIVFLFIFKFCLFLRALRALGLFVFVHRFIEQYYICHETLSIYIFYSQPSNGIEKSKDANKLKNLELCHA